MSKVKVELNNSGVIALFRSSEVQGWLGDLGQQVANRAGSDYASEVHVLGGTAVVTVFPNSERAAHDNFKNNTLLKAAGTVGVIGKKPKL